MSNKMTLANDVLKAVKDLGADGAHVTTLVVKNYLRLSGFNATQERVSSYMHEWAERGELEKRDMGQWHEFWLANKGPKHWSESKGEWLLVKEMHSMHILNALAKYLRQAIRESIYQPTQIEDMQHLVDELGARLKEKTAGQ